MSKYAQQQVNRSPPSRAQLEQTFGHTFADGRILTEALCAWPSPKIGRDPTGGNKRLAMIGDRIINVALDEESRSRGLDAGEMNHRREQFLSNKHLNEVGRGAGLVPFIELNPGSTQVSDYMVATAVEAVFGAIFMDAGQNPAAVVAGMRNLGLLNR